METLHHITPTTPHTIQRRTPSGAWESIAYRPNVAETDATLRQLIAFNAGKGVRFRAVPFAPKFATA